MGVLQAVVGDVIVRGVRRRVRMFVAVLVDRAVVVRVLGAAWTSASA